MSLREKTKQKNQRNILKTAEKKFKEQGYQQTSMTEIAREAEVGTGTIYNYFPSKGALLITLFSMEMKTLRNKMQTELHDDSVHFMEQLKQFLQRTLAFIEHYPKSFWQELMPVLTDQSKEQTDFRNEALQLDMEAIVWFEQLIKKHQDMFKLSVDAKQGAFAIYSVMVTQTMLYVYDQDMTYDQLLVNTKKQIQFLFDGKLKEGDS
ncbi:TetR/AcrR family transcriptional regulator [Lentibacillus salicampi]|uniref:TetR/AcrR family transcriptional regulator n=1 Tax=Lentibacillus salicampi TaxID=175306 RepID=UPI001431FBDB|nr:TetR/AcrR family transcriptional regulator [Lentibacillus salicampi]